MSLFASLFPLICWLGYSWVVARIEGRRPSLSTIMNGQRRRWVANAVNRDTPIDAILASNLMGSISFFASTTALLVLALFAVFGQLDAVAAALNRVTPGLVLSPGEIEIHIAVLVAMLILAFLAFTLSLRQFNHFCIMLGAADHTSHGNKAEIATIAELNSLGARNFNQGIRAYYFAVGALAWFWHPWAAIAATLGIVALLLHREFFSAGRALVASLHQHED